MESAGDGLLKRDRTQSKLVKCCFPGKEEQQDADEHINRIFGDALDCGVDVFAFEQIARITCKSCHHSTTKRDASSELSIRLPDDGGDFGIGLGTLLHRYSKAQDLDGYRCTNKNCRKVGTCTPYTSLDLGPSTLLTVVLRTYSADLVKIPRPVTLTERLDVAIEGPEGVASYRLRSIIRHKGTSVKSGHYKAAVRGEEGSRKLYSDDEEPEEITRTEAMDTSTTADGEVDAPYVLLFEPDSSGRGNDSSSSCSTSSSASSSTGSGCESGDEENAGHEGVTGYAEQGGQVQEVVPIVNKETKTPVAGDSRGEVVADTGRGGLTACGVLDLLSIVSAKERSVLTAALQNSENFQAWLFKQKLPNLLAMERHQVDTKIAKLLPDASEDSRPTAKQIANWQHRQRLRLESEMEMKSPAAVESWVWGAYRSADVFFEDPDSVDDSETLLVGYHCTARGGVVISFTTKPLLKTLQHAAPRSGSTQSPFFSSDTRYGQLAAQLGVCTSGFVVLTLDHEQATRSSLYWFSYSVISVECRETSQTVSGHLVDLFARSVGVKHVLAMTFGHDSRPGQAKGIDTAVAQRAEGVRVSHSEDFFHVIKNIGDQVPRQLVASGKQNKKSGKTTLGDFQKMAATIAHRVRQWVWFIRLLFNLWRGQVVGG
eukprot:g11551.t1